MRTRLAAIIVLVAALGARPGLAQQELHFEGYAKGLSISAPGDPVLSVGLVSAIYGPLNWDNVHNEYTYSVRGLVSRGSVATGATTWSTQFDLTGATFMVYEDPGQDARPTFYDCPAGISPPPDADPSYTNGTVYLSGHFVSFQSAYDAGTNQGTWTFGINWDGGSHLADLPLSQRGTAPGGNGFMTNFACVPAGYAEALTGQLFQFTTPVQGSTWGTLRRLYR